MGNVVFIFVLFISSSGSMTCVMQIVSVRSRLGGDEDRKQFLLHYSLEGE